MPEIPSRLRSALCAVAIMGSVVACGGDDRAPSAGDTRITSFAVWYAPGAPDDFGALAAMLTADGNATVERYDSSVTWMAAEADVLVLRGTDETWSMSDDPLLWDHDFAPLTERRVLGIGHEAGTAFGSIGLDVCGDGGASFDESEPTIHFGDGEVVPTHVAETRLVAFRADDLANGPATWGCEGLHLPPTEELAQHVEAVARWADDPDYAPISRQGNFVLCGIAADIRSWTPEFTASFREIAMALAQRPKEPFRPIEWEITPPGTHEFELAVGGRSGAASGRTFFFRFDEPVLFSARLEMRTGGTVMLFFHGQKTDRAMERVDAKQGETLTISAPINETTLHANGDRYWELSVTNFDYGTPATCTLQIDVDPDATLRFPDGTEISLHDTPTDTPTVERLIDFLSSADTDVARDAKTALLMIGDPALPAVEAAKSGASESLGATLRDIDIRITE